jgi:hypothetical protein
MIFRECKTYQYIYIHCLDRSCVLNQISIRSLQLHGNPKIKENELNQDLIVDKTTHCWFRLPRTELE